MCFLSPGRWAGYAGRRGSARFNHSVTQKPQQEKKPAVCRNWEQSANIWASYSESVKKLFKDMMPWDSSFLGILHGIKRGYATCMVSCYFELGTPDWPTLTQVMDSNLLYDQSYLTSDCFVWSSVSNAPLSFFIPFLKLRYFLTQLLHSWAPTFMDSIESTIENLKTSLTVI